MELVRITEQDPETAAYQKARLSRSKQKIQDIQKEITSDKVASLHQNFGYGHASIRDLAPLSLAVQDISWILAYYLMDERLINAQEASSRYQNFKDAGYYLPVALRTGGVEEAAARGIMDKMVDQYERETENVIDLMKSLIPCPKDMGIQDYKSAIRSKALDVTRGLLPLGMKTRLAIDATARVWGRIIDAAAHRGNYSEETLFAAHLKQYMSQWMPNLLDRAGFSVHRAAEIATLKQAVAEIIGDTEAESNYDIQLHLNGVPMRTAELEIAATAVYNYSNLSYQQSIETVLDLNHRTLMDFVSLVSRTCDTNEWLRFKKIGYPLIFDIRADFKIISDLKRHRDCIIHLQPLTREHGALNIAEEITHGLPSGTYEPANNWVRGWRQYEEEAGKYWRDEEIPKARDYFIPVAYKQGALFKMDLGEAAYIIKLRTGKGGHFSYRRLAWKMYRALVNQGVLTGAFASEFYGPTNPDEHDWLNRSK